jgi:metallo-beta-lactamase family protein
VLIAILDLHLHPNRSYDLATLTFLGAARTVTGSRYLLNIKGKRILIDCGLFQGPKEHRRRNWTPFPVPPASIDSVFLTHAHVDHIGYLPKLVKEGFSGKVYATYATADLAELALLDTAHIMEEDAEWANKKGYSKHSPALPLYTVEDAKRAIKMIKRLRYGEDLFLLDDMRAKFKDAGHILGSSFVDMKINLNKESRKIVFGGDLGRPDRPILRSPVQAFNVDYLLIESTYGDRAHDDLNQFDEIARVINEGVKRGGGIVIPSFAVERTQELLYVIRDLEERALIPELPVYVDSPMAIDATDIFEKHISEQDLTARILTLKGKNIYRPKHVEFVETVEHSKAINTPKGQAIIISSSGMATAGRVLHHLRKRLPHACNTILFVGYQVMGTRGRKIVDGAKTIRIHGQDIKINAHIENIDAFSAHADYNVMLAWLMGFNRPPETTFIVHGELEAAESLAQKIRDLLGWDIVIPEMGDKVELEM